MTATQETGPVPDADCAAERVRRPAAAALRTPQRGDRLQQYALLGCIAVTALLIRTQLFSYQTSDWTVFLKPWYEFITANGGFGALKHSFSDYNVPYLYIMATLSYLPIPALTGIKIVSVAADLLMAFFVFRIVGMRYFGNWVPALAAAVVVFLPTVVVNGAMWGQADSLYAAFALGGIYYLLQNRPTLGCVFFGVALAFKLQTVFVLPVLLVLVLLRHLPWRALLAVPGVYLLLDVPALIIGADPVKLLTIYAAQTDTYQDLTLNAPSIYQFLGMGASTPGFRTAGVLLAGSAVLILTLAVVVHRPRITDSRLILLATAAAIVVPLLLPSMHERYFYLADVLSVIAAFYLPRRLWHLPLAVQFSSFLSYVPYLFLQHAEFNGVKTTASLPQLDFRILTVAMLVAAVVVVRESFRQFSLSPYTGTHATHYRAARR